MIRAVIKGGSIISKQTRSHFNFPEASLF